MVEGVGNAPAVQKLGGKEEEQQGYLGAAYSLAGNAVRTVYDAAGNVVCSPRTGVLLQADEWEDWYRQR